MVRHRCDRRPAALSAVRPSVGHRARTDADTAGMKQESRPYVITRTPILDRQDRLVGQHLRLLDGDPASLLARLAEWPTRTRLFLDVPVECLDDTGALAAVGDRVVVCPTGDAARAGADGGGVAAVRARGLPLALTDVNPRSTWLAHLGSAQYVGVDPERVPAAHLPRYVEALHRRHARVIATAVRRRDRRSDAQDAGFDLIEGDWFLRDPKSGQSRVDPAYSSVLRALCLAQDEAPLMQIEASLRADPALAFRLLRYANSAARSPGNPVRSLGDALHLIGYRPLARWLGLALVTARVDTGTHGVLSLTGAQRARLMELISPQLATRIDANDAFFTGLISVLPAMFEMPLEGVIEALMPRPDVAQALRTRAGPLGALLHLACCGEDDDAAALVAARERLGLSAAAVTEAMLAAMAWAEQAQAGE